VALYNLMKNEWNKAGYLKKRPAIKVKPKLNNPTHILTQEVYLYLIIGKRRN
jgi:hypothetical protein